MQLRTGELISEQYKILSLIGRGGWGDVFKAEHVSLGKFVAVKILHAYLSDDQEKLERFRREARLASTIKHPYICPVFDFGVTPAGETYYVMDLIEGETLESILERDKFLPAGTAVPLFTKICDVLSVAHQQGILHRDLKPSNIIIRSNGDPVLLDFGLAKLRGEKPADYLSVTVQGTTVGTPMFMSPEQCLGEAVDERSDIYSLGCMLYLTLSGKPPFDAQSHLEVMRRQVREPAPAIRCAAPIPDNVESAVIQALEKDPKQRQQTVAEFRNQLMAAPGSSKSAKRSPGKRENKKPTALIASASVLALVVAAGAVYWSLSHQTNKPQSASKQTAQTAAKVTPAQLKDVIEAAYTRGDNYNLETAAFKLIDLYSDKQLPAEDAAGTLSRVQKLLNGRGLFVTAEKAGTVAINRLKEIEKPASPTMVALEMEQAQTYFLEAGTNRTLTSDWCYSSALFWAEQLLDKVQHDVEANGGSQDILAQVLMQKERLLDCEQRYREAITIGKQCLPMVEKTSADPAIKARAYMADALAQGLTGNIDLSLKEYQREIDLETLAQGPGGSEVANGYGAIAQMFEARGDLKQAAGYFARAEDLFRKLPEGDPQKSGFRPVFEKWLFFEGVHPEPFYNTLHTQFRSNWLGIRAQNPYFSNFEPDHHEVRKGPDTIINEPGMGVAPALKPETLSRCRTLDLAGTRLFDSNVAALPPMPDLERLLLTSTDITDRVAPSLEKFRGLRFLDLSVTPVGHQCAAAAMKLPHLQILNVATTQVRDRDFALLAACPSLERLQLEETVTDDAALRLLSKSRSLKSLDLRSTLITDKGLQYLGSIPQLQRLELAFNRLDGTGLRNLPKLTHLCLNAPIGREFKIDGIAGMKSLRVLQLPMTPTTDADLSFLPQLQSLEEINLACTDVGDSTVAILKQLPKLKKINLNHTKISNHALAELAECKNLEELHISQDNVQDISPLKNLPNLKLLSLNDDPIGDESLETLRSLPKLSRLLISRTKFSRAGVMKLAQDLHLSHLEILAIDVGIDGIVTLASQKSCYVVLSLVYLTPQQRRTVQQRLLGKPLVTQAE